MHIFGITTKAT